MSGLSNFRAAAILAESKAAGALDHDAVLALIPADEPMAPADAVAALKAAKPQLFRLKHARDMQPEEYAAAKRKLNRDAELRRVGLTPRN